MPYSSFTWYWLPVPNLACHSPGRSRSRYGFWSRATSWSTGRTVQSTLGRCYAPDSSAATSLQDTPWRVTYSPYIQPHMVLSVFIVIITIIVVTAIIAVTITIVTSITTMIMITIMMIIIITVMMIIIIVIGQMCKLIIESQLQGIPSKSRCPTVPISKSP